MEVFAKRILTLLGAVALLSYVGYHIFMAAYSPVTLQTAELYDEYETVDTEGFIVRNESLIPLASSGYVYYIAENGSRVAKEGRIADLYDTQESAVTQQKINDLNAEIEQLQLIQDQGQNNRTNLDIITTQMKKVQAEMIGEMSAPYLTQVESISDELLALMNKQQITIGRTSDFSARISALTAERDRLMQTGAKSTGSVYSPIAGYFVNTVDGFEAAINADDVLSITVDEVRAAMEQQPTVDSSKYIGKVVGSYEWYLVCVIPAEQMTHLALDSTVRLRLPFVSNETIPVTIVAENRDRNGDLAVVFRCDYMSAELSDIRIEQVQILVKQHSGLRVPDEAVRFNENQEAGVFVQEGNVIYFRRIQVAYHSDKENYSICAVVNDDSYLQAYDDIVLEGKDLYDGKIVR